MAYRATAKTRAKKAETQRRIQKACFQLVREQEFNAVTVSRVAELAGIATGSIYSHFPTKADLLAEIFRYCTEHEIDAVARAATSESQPAARLHSAVETFCRRAISSPRLAWALIAEPIAPEVEKERLRFRQAYTQIFADIIEAGVERGDFISQNSPLTAAAIVGALGEVLLAPLTQDNAGVEPPVKNTKGGLSGPDITEQISQLIARMAGSRVNSPNSEENRAP